MRILVDMDSIIVDLLTEWIRVYNQEWGDCLSKAEVTDWDTHKFVLPECGKKVYDILMRPGFFDYLPEIPGAVGAITDLHHSGHDIRFATTPPSPDSCRGKIEWIARHFKHLNYKMDRMIFTHDKLLLAPSVDVLIDDKPTTITDWRQHSDIMDATRLRRGPRIMTITYPYNREAAKKAHVAADGYMDTKQAWRKIVSAVHTETIARNR